MIGRLFGLILFTSLDAGDRPLFFEMKLSDHPIFETREVGEVSEENFVEPLVLEMKIENGNPRFYESSIRTTVCDDEICEIMSIRLFWDLAGSYIGYDTLAGHPLTKFDHEPFTQLDYQRLHELLQNEGSILKFKEKEELIDKKEVRASDVIDGTTGATAKEIKEEVVEGALYSSYTLWHLAYNGSIKNQIQSQTKLHMNEVMKSEFFHSNRPGYQLMAVQNMNPEDYNSFQTEWLDVLKNGIPLVRKQLINQIPDSVWNQWEIQESICTMIPDFDVNSRTLLLNKLLVSDKVYPQSLEMISREIDKLNKKQLIDYLNLLEDRGDLTLATRSNLNKSKNDQRFRYSYLLKDDYQK